MYVKRQEIFPGGCFWEAFSCLVVYNEFRDNVPDGIKSWGGKFEKDVYLLPVTFNG